MSGIVVGVDGSHHSQRALDWAINEAAVRQAPLTVVTVSRVSSDIYGIAPEHYPADEESRGKVLAATREVVDKAIASYHGKPPVVTVRAISGLPADILIQASVDADMLVVGARGAGGFGRLLMGSVSSQVTHHALCPVVVVPSERAH